MKQGNNAGKPFLGAFLALFLVVIFFSIGIEKLICSFQSFLFDKKGSLIFTTSLGLWIALPMIMLFFMLLIFVFLILTRYIKQLPRDFQIRKDKKDKKLINSIFLVGGFILLVSLFNYVIVTENGVFFRDVRTGFREKFYTWKQLKRIDIESYENSRSWSANLRILVVLGNARINLMNASFYKENWLSKLRLIYQIAEKNDTQFKKKIEFIDEGNQRILDYIERGFLKDIP